MAMKLGSASTAFAVSVFKENANVTTALGNAYKVSMQARDGTNPLHLPSSSTTHAAQPQASCWPKALTPEDQQG